MRRCYIHAMSGSKRTRALPAVGALPDVRDGLTRKERVVLWVLGETQRELDGRNVPTAMLYGRVVEHIDISADELQRILRRLAGR